jgi:hypothetical protein
MLGRHPESVEMRMPAIVSAMLHVVLMRDSSSYPKVRR